MATGAYRSCRWTTVSSGDGRRGSSSALYVPDHWSSGTRSRHVPATGRCGRRRWPPVDHSAAAGARLRHLPASVPSTRSTWPRWPAPATAGSRRAAAPAAPPRRAGLRRRGTRRLDRSQPLQRPRRAPLRGRTAVPIDGGAVDDRTLRWPPSHPRPVVRRAAPGRRRGRWSTATAPRPAGDRPSVRRALAIAPSSTGGRTPGRGVGDELAAPAATATDLEQVVPAARLDSPRVRAARRRGRRPGDAVRRQGGRRRAVLSVERGTITAVLGPNGAGKTTTLETCEGYRTPQAGTVRVLGLDPLRERRALLPRIGVMLQAGGAWSGVRAMEMLQHIARLHAHPLDVDDARRAARARRLRPDAVPAALRRPAAAARAGDGASSGGPELVFVDEPTAGHGPAGAAQHLGAARASCAPTA